MFFLEISCFFYDPTDFGNLISGSSAFSKYTLNIWKFMVHILLKPGLDNFEHYFASMWDECSCTIVLTFFGISFHWDWSENWPFPILWSFPNMLAYWLQNFLFYYYYYCFNFILFLNFTILYWFCHTSTWIHHRHIRVPHPEPSSLLPPHTVPLGCPSAPAPSIQYRASNLDWWLISYMILYVFQCHSPKSSHPLPLPQSPKDCSIHHCLFCFLVYRVIVTIFLNSIYMR